jgi:hypothetical protein
MIKHSSVQVKDQKYLYKRAAPFLISPFVSEATQSAIWSKISTIQKLPAFDSLKLSVAIKM